MRSPSLAASSMSWVTKTIDFLSSCLQLEELVLQALAGDGVHRGEGLVHEQHRGIGAERPGHPDPLALATGELVREAPGVVLGVEADEFEQLVDAALDPGAVPPEQAGNDGDVVEDAAVREEAALLDHVADAPAHQHRVLGRARSPRR